MCVVDLSSRSYTEQIRHAKTEVGIPTSINDNNSSLLNKLHVRMYVRSLSGVVLPTTNTIIQSGPLQTCRASGRSKSRNFKECISIYQYLVMMMMVVVRKNRLSPTSKAMMAAALGGTTNCRVFVLKLSRKSNHLYVLLCNSTCLRQNPLQKV